MGRAITLASLGRLPEIEAGDDLGAAIAAAAPRDLAGDDILVVAHKAISKAEGRTVRLSEVTPGEGACALATEHEKDPRHVEVVLRESAELVRAERGVLVCRTHHGLVCANAGVDASNAAAHDEVVLLPADPDRSARALRARVGALRGVRPAVLVTDTFGRPWRLGQTDVAIGAAGLAALEDWRGRPDSHGREMRATVIAVADAVAGAADLARAKDSGEPLVLVRGLGDHVREEDGPGAAVPPTPARGGPVPVSAGSEAAPVSGKPHSQLVVASASSAVRESRRPLDQRGQPMKTAGRSTPIVVLIATVWATFLLAPSSAFAERTSVRSFDGTKIVVNFFRAEGLRAGERAPTVLVGPGFSAPGETDPDSESSDEIGSVGLGPLRRAGYNAVTFDPRGFGESGGEAKIDSPDFEARDVSRIIDYLARRGDVSLDRPGDPVVGMSGASYGGGIQFVTAATDARVDAITPTIAWQTLVRSLFTSGDVKAGWGSALCGLGQVNGLAPGLIAPGGFQTGSVDRHVTDACVEGTAFGKVSPENIKWFRDRGPARLVRRIKAPTLIIQGTVDTLFTPQEAIDNHRLMSDTGVPLRTMWFCGGHGACLTGGGKSRHVERRVIAWLDRWLKDDRTAAVGPKFEWIADDDRWRAADRFPLPRVGSLRGTGSGVLPLSAAQTSGGLVLATPVQAGGLDVEIESASRTTELLGAPRVELAYRGTATPASTFVYAQIVDEQRNIVVGNQATPIPVRLDGRLHRVSVPLAPISAHATRGDSYRLQIVPSTTLFHEQNSSGALTVQRADVRLPVVTTQGGAGGGSSGGGGGRTITGTAGDDVIRCGSGNDRVDAGGGDDVVYCGSGDDVISGGAGDDRLYGESGNDRLDGGPGDDLMDGGSGDDRMTGGPGADRARGGGGRNTTAG